MHSESTIDQELVSIRRSRHGHELVMQDGGPAHLEQALRRVVRGEVRFDAGSRGAYASDASNYHMVPLAVVVPRAADDVVRAMEVCREHDVPVYGRGGGTSLAGQCVNLGVVFDFSKYMNEIVEIDPRRKTARVQPGVVLDDLRAAVGEHDLTFGPDTSTHDRCTIGGMLGNNACGVHAIMSEFYGPGPRTEHNVVAMDVLTYDGERMTVTSVDEDTAAAIAAEGGRRAEIYRSLRSLRERHEGAIRDRMPDIQRQVSGYNLPALFAENGFDLARALVGSESTCVLILEATISLIPARPDRALVVLGYPSVYQAGDHVPQIREARPVGLEGLDRRLLDYMHDKHMHPVSIEMLPEGDGWLMVELSGEREGEAREAAHALMDRLSREETPPSMALFEGEDAAKIWAVRESGLGATAFAPGRPDTWPGWEDAAVAPARVGAYLRDFRALLDDYGYDCSLYGHFGQGCIHTRIDFELEDEAGREHYAAFTRDAADLVARYRGSLSGEHGDGQARGDLLERLYGPELMTAFREFKAIWDPRGRMNPGKVVDAFDRTEDLRLAQYHPVEPAVEFAYPEDGGSFAHAAVRCVGVGKCRATNSGVMCPSYMVTREEKHSTRGRARLLYEMMQGEVISDGWKSEAVKDALELCLACKGCKAECPVSVDMATYKAEFNAHHYAGRLRPRQAYAFGWIHRWARLGGAMPRLANFVTQTPGLSRLAKWIAGIAPERRIPRFARTSFRREASGWARDVGDQRPPVILWADTFNDHFFPGVLRATAEVLDDAGYRVVVPTEPLCCGRALYDWGMLGLARRLWEQTFDALADEIAAGTPIVGAEPSCVAAFRDELPNLFPADARARRLSEHTHTLAEFLTGVADYQPPVSRVQAIVHGHCHHRSIMGLDADRALWDRIGLDYELLDSGCCGMAGSFGFERGRKYEVSVAAGERRLLPRVRDASRETVVMTDGFSCREQILQLTGRRPLHLAEVLRAARTNGRGLGR